MITRATSRAAYKELIESGLLKGKQRLCLLAVIEHGPATSGEIIRAAKLGANINLWRARFTELVARGLIMECGSRACKATGRKGLVWEATGRTKPLDVKKGHRVDGKAWRDIAERLWKDLRQSGALDDVSEARYTAEIEDMLS